MQCEREITAYTVNVSFAQNDSQHQQHHVKKMWKEAKYCAKHGITTINEFDIIIYNHTSASCHVYWIMTQRRKTRRLDMVKEIHATIPDQDTDLISSHLECYMYFAFCCHKTG